jgi:hypothetical protein
MTSPKILSDLTLSTAGGLLFYDAKTGLGATARLDAAGRYPYSS